ncbi:MAG: transcription elongation factor GreB [Deltaproteobacteria bacterium]|nr:transcription elongation factor GreB [Deltaproteobacteria bacterium]
MAKSYITPAGAAKLQAELKQLVEIERPKTVDEVATAAAHGDRSENAEYKYGKLRLRDVDRRIRFLEKRMDTIEVVDPATRSSDAVFFGATVEVVDEDGNHRSYQIVGEDETAPEQGLVSYVSPIGRALLKRKVGDLVTVRRPAGDLELEVVKVSYRAIGAHRVSDVPS